MAIALEIGVLGPVEAHVGERAVILARMERVVLAVLVVNVGEAVSTDRLLEVVWNCEPPGSGVGTLHSIVSRLRRKLGHDAIELVDHAYRLAVEPEQIDMVRFEKLLREASALIVEDPPVAASLAVGALALWRGTPFGDLHDVDFLKPELARLEALRLSALEVRLEADVACGRLALAIASLENEIAEHPFRERLWYLLILALARDGRRVDALRACQRLRIEIAQIGLEPTADVRELERMIFDEAAEVRFHLHD